VDDRFEVWEKKLGLQSFDPLQLLELADAVRERRETVNLGKNFSLVYREEKVFYSPVDGYTPCGWIAIAKLEEGP